MKLKETIKTLRQNVNKLRTELGYLYRVQQEVNKDMWIILSINKYIERNDFKFDITSHVVIHNNYIFYMKIGHYDIILGCYYLIADGRAIRNFSLIENLYDLIIKELKNKLTT